MFQLQEIKEICSKYGIIVENVSDVIDTSHGAADIRYNYIIDHKYVLKINTAPMVTEAFLRSINCLVERYRDIGVWCPEILVSLSGEFLHEFVQEGTVYKAYIEEYATYATAEQKDVDEFCFKKKMVGHLGKLAAKYTGIELVEHRSMWSIIDLAPLDVDVDEKQENCDLLCEVLRKAGYEDDARRLVEVNEEARQRIKEHFAELPRCVYQGDLNFSNLLVDEEGEFKGLIDFNMYGTEVNINCFLNETMFLEEKDFETLSAVEIHEKLRNAQEELLGEILQYYSLNEAEQKCFEAYRKIAELFQYPHVMQWKYFLEQGRYVDKVIALIRIIAGMR